MSDLGVAGKQKSWPTRQNVRHDQLLLQTPAAAGGPPHGPRPDQKWRPLKLVRWCLRSLVLPFLSTIGTNKQQAPAPQAQGLYPSKVLCFFNRTPAMAPIDACYGTTCLETKAPGNLLWHRFLFTWSGTTFLAWSGTTFCLVWHHFLLGLAPLMGDIGA